MTKCTHLFNILSNQKTGFVSSKEIFVEYLLNAWNYSLGLGLGSGRSLRRKTKQIQVLPSFFIYASN